MKPPRVSVVLPVFNGGSFIKEAVASILSQTFTDFELIVIDDGSTDGSAARVRQAAAGDRRLVLISRENRGLVATLNEGIAMARGKYVARMDADDMSLPQRLKTQVDFLERHARVAVVGSWVKTMGGWEHIWKHPAAPAMVESALLFRCPLAHPSVMMRRSLFSRNGFAYDPAAKHVEDYALWLAVAEKHKLANIPEVLLRYRTHEGQISVANQHHQYSAAVKLQLAFIERRLRVRPSEKEEHYQFCLAYSAFDDDPDFVAGADLWLEKLAAANERLRAFPRLAFLHTLTGRYVALYKFAESCSLEPSDPYASSFGPYIHPGALSP